MAWATYPATARSRTRTTSHPPAWVAGHLTTILHGQAARAATEITAQADQTGLHGTRREGADACVRHPTGQVDHLRYDTALAAGWSIATGPIEGACRHLIGDRLDISGSRCVGFLIPEVGVAGLPPGGRPVCVTHDQDEVERAGGLLQSVKAGVKRLLGLSAQQALVGS